MNTKEISDCLTAELGVITNLRDTALEKQKALICSEGNGIEIYTYKEEQLLSLADDGVKLKRPGFHGQLIKPHV